MKTEKENIEEIQKAINDSNDGGSEYCTEILFKAKVVLAFLYSRSEEAFNQMVNELIKQAKEEAKAVSKEMNKN